VACRAEFVSMKLWRGHSCLPPRIRSDAEDLTAGLNSLRQAMRYLVSRTALFATEAKPAMT